MGMITFFVFLLLEVALLIWSISSKQEHRRERAVIRIASLVLFVVLTFAGVYKWGFQYVPLMALLIIQAGYSAVYLIRASKVKSFSSPKMILRCVRNGLVLFLVLVPAVIFPQYEQPVISGTYEVLTTKYTWIDNSRTNEFVDESGGRKLTVDFWYPDISASAKLDGSSEDQTYPLVVFSHGAFGFSGSNYSTCAELASNGYIVASISHTHQAFFTKDVDGTITIADADFIDEASRINAVQDTGNDEDIFNITSAWMKLRTDDENFVIDQIIKLNATTNEDRLLPVVDIDRIGLMGHSLGGATSAQIGRERGDIDAVVVLDGTMLGEEIDFNNGAVVLNSEPYPVPLLNIYAEDHYENAVKFDGDGYNNFYATSNAIEAYETVFTDAGHLNFTDLPLFSPVLAQALGTGTVDEFDCISTMNSVVLKFFDAYLKGNGKPDIEKNY
jgi:dienelactone hydrolase